MALLLAFYLIFFVVIPASEYSDAGPVPRHRAQTCGTSILPRAAKAGTWTITPNHSLKRGEPERAHRCRQKNRGRGSQSRFTGAVG